MKKFKVKHKTGFAVINASNLLILDSRKVPFYYREKLTKTFKFNLPKGTYYTPNELVKLSKPVYYSTPKIKERYHFESKPKKLKIIFANNPNKCSVDLKNGIIIFDYSYKNAPRFIVDYIIGHELGHYKYSGKGLESEKDCDVYSSYLLLKYGYNPSQIHAAANNSLGENYVNQVRKFHNYLFLNNTIQNAR